MIPIEHHAATGGTKGRQGGTITVFFVVGVTITVDSKHVRECGVVPIGYGLCIGGGDN